MSWPHLPPYPLPPLLVPALEHVAAIRATLGTATTQQVRMCSATTSARVRAREFVHASSCTRPACAREALERLLACAQNESTSEVDGQIRTLDAEELPEDLVPLLDLVCPHLPPPPAIVHVSGGCKRQRPSFVCPSRTARSYTDSEQGSSGGTTARHCHKASHYAAPP